MTHWEVGVSLKSIAQVNSLQTIDDWLST